MSKINLTDHFHLFHARFCVCCILVTNFLFDIDWQIAFASEGKEESKIKVENANVVEMIKKWYLGGTRGVSPSTISCLANKLSAELSK